MLKQFLNKVSVQQKATVVYMIASVFTQGVNFLTLPIYTRLLSTADMGVMTTFVSWYSIIYTIGTLSLTSTSMSIAMMKFENKRDQYQSICLVLSTISAIVFTIAYFTMKNIFHFGELFSTPIMIIISLLMIFQPALDSFYLRQRYEYKYKSVLLVSILTSVLSVIFPILVIYILKKYNGGTDLAEARIVIQYGVMILVSIIIYIIIMRKGHCLYENVMVKFALRMSAPLIIHTLAKNILDTSARLMISTMCGNSAAGIFGTVYNISMIALIVWNAINAAVVPYIFETLKVKKYDAVERLVFKVLLLFSMVSIVITLIAPEILSVMTTKEYYSAVHMIPAIAAGIYFTAVYGIYGNMLLYAEKPMMVMIATTIAALANIGLNYILIIKFGYMAAAYATLLSFILLAVLQGIMQIKVFKREVVSSRKMVWISGFTVTICLLCNMIYDYLIIRIAIVCILLIVIIAFWDWWISIFKNRGI